VTFGLPIPQRYPCGPGGALAEAHAGPIFERSRSQWGPGSMDVGPFGRGSFDRCGAAELRLRVSFLASASAAALSEAGAGGGLELRGVDVHDVPCEEYAKPSPVPEPRPTS
jgi:hypothetical protein